MEKLDIKLDMRTEAGGALGYNPTVHPSR